MSKRGIVWGVGLAILVWSLFTATADAEDASQKFARGAINTSTGWVDLPKEMANQVPEDPYRGLTYGFVDGISHGLQRTLYGAWDVATFAIPPYNRPKMEPETPFGNLP